MEAEAGHSRAHQRCDVGFIAAKRDGTGIQTFQQMGYLLQVGHGGNDSRIAVSETVDRGSEADRPLRASVHFDSCNVLSDSRTQDIAIFIPSANAILLIRPGDDSHRSPWAQSQLLHEYNGLPCSQNATAVIVGPLTDVPGIDMPAKHYDFVGPLASDDLTHDIRGAGVRQGLPFHVELYTHLLSHCAI
jgi:hypothetical protein